MILYSTNVFLKFHIQQLYYNDLHYVWCSDNFDSAKVSAYSAGHLVPPSSNPADIYRQLKAETTKKDRHSSKILEQQNSIKNQAVRYHASGSITETAKEDIFFMVDNASFDDWRPLLYLIPKQPILSRVEQVPIAKRASNGMEFIIKDLLSTEFHVIEF